MIPEVSPLRLLQEHDTVREDPWRVLVVCVLCNRTRGSRVRDVMEKVFRRWSSAALLAGASERELADVLFPLGLHRMRAKRLIAMSRGWNNEEHLKDGKGVVDLEGVGIYGADAYALFVEGRTDVTPTDKELRRYLEWRLS